MTLTLTQIMPWQVLLLSWLQVGMGSPVHKHTYLPPTAQLAHYQQRFGMQVCRQCSVKLLQFRLFLFSCNRRKKKTKLNVIYVFEQLLILFLLTYKRKKNESFVYYLLRQVLGTYCFYIETYLPSSKELRRPRSST